MPPSATAPVYKEKVYVKALRMPKETELKFKNDDYFSKKKSEAKPKNVDLFASAKDENINDNTKFNSANSAKAAAAAKDANNNNNNKSNSYEDKKVNKGNDLHNLINGGSSAKAESENINKKVNKDDKNDDSEFTFHNRNKYFYYIFKKFLNVFMNFKI